MCAHRLGVRILGDYLVTREGSRWWEEIDFGSGQFHRLMLKVFKEARGKNLVSDANEKAAFLTADILLLNAEKLQRVGVYYLWEPIEERKFIR